MKKTPLSSLAFVLSASLLLAGCRNNNQPSSSSSQEASSSQAQSSSIVESSSSKTPESSPVESSSVAAPVLSDFALNTDAVKKEYSLGETFDPTGLTATGKVTENGTTTDVTYQLSDLDVDSSAFVGTLAGFYNIAVSPKAFPESKQYISVGVFGELRVVSAKTAFALKEAFSFDDLVLAYYRGVDASGQESSTNVNPKGRAVTVDSSSYNAEVLGKYTINVSYAVTSNKTLTASYEVEVQSKVAGLALTKTTTVYTLDGSLTMNIPVDDIAVYAVNQYGIEETAALESSEYTLSYYKDGNVQIDSLNDVGPGIYQIWASRTIVLYGEQYDVSDFAIVYVNDPVTAIAPIDEGAVLTQEQGADVMSSTWTFTVTHSSGATEVVDATKVKIEGLDTKTVAKDAEATITYTAKDSDGTSHTVTTKVTYTITEKAQEGEWKDKTYYYQFAAEDLADPITEETTYISDAENGNYVSVLATSSAAVKVTANSCSADGHSFTHRLQLNGKGSTSARSFKIVLARAADLSLWFKSGKTNESRSLAVYDETGTVIDGTTVANDGNTVGKVAATLEAGTYYVYGTTACNVYGVQIDTTVEAKPEAKNYFYQLAAGDLADPISADTTYISDETYGNSVSVLATSSAAVKVTANSCSADGHSFTHRLQLNGKGSTSARSLKFVLARAGDISVWFKSGKTNESRSLAVYDETGTVIDGTTVANDGNTVGKVTATLEAGTYYVYGTTACNVYGFEINTTIIAK